MTTKIMEAIEKVAEDTGTPEDVQIIKALIKKAKEGDIQAIKLIMNYTDGMPSQDLDLTTAGQPLTVNIVSFAGHGANPPA